MAVAAAVAVAATKAVCYLPGDRREAIVAAAPGAYVGWPLKGGPLLAFGLTVQVVPLMRRPLGSGPLLAFCLIGHVEPLLAFGLTVHVVPLTSLDSGSCGGGRGGGGTGGGGGFLAWATPPCY